MTAEKCEKFLDRALEHPLITFLFKELEKSGCVMNREKISISDCEGARAGGFSPNSGIILCKNQILSKQHLQDTLAHELIHAYDHCTVHVDWDNPEMLACSEIRAAALSGECHFTRELMRGNFGIAKHFQTCVKRRAILGVGQVFPGSRVAQDAVGTVWDKCFPDTAPFDEHY